MFTVNESIQGRLLYLTRVGTARRGCATCPHIYYFFRQKWTHVNICSTPNFVQGPFNMILWLYEKYSLSKSCNKKLLKCLEVAKWVVIMCIRFINEKNTFSVFRRTVGLIRIFGLRNTSYTHFAFIFSVFRRTVGRIRSLFWNILKSN